MYSAYDEAFMAETYDHVVPYRTRPDVDFFVTAARESGGPVLELGCGTGRVLIPTARSGVPITGLDASEAMLEACRRRLEDESDEVRERVALFQGRMENFGLEGKFALITTPFRPFQHLLTVEDQIACLRQAHAHLVDGGRLILDLFSPSIPRLAQEPGSAMENSPEFTMPDGRRILRKDCITRRDLVNQVNDIDLIYEITHTDGAEERRIVKIQMRYLFRFEAEHLLARCGFAVEALYGDYDRSPYGATYPGELIFVAQKT